MNKTIKKLNEFFETTLDKKLLINEVNEEISSFYVFLLFYLTNNTATNLKITQNLTQINNDADLFGQQNISVFRTTNSRDINVLLKSNSKVIILTNYKNFKKYQNLQESINGYNYLDDIKYLLKNIMKIEDMELINFCLNSPELIYSETSKYLVNSEGYLKEEGIVKISNFIVDIRKSIFDSKQKVDIRKTFYSIKKEALYKRFSFLTY